LTTMGEPDEIVRSVVRARSIRVVAVTTTGVAREAARRHAAGSAGAVALARGLTAGLLLATLTKDEERVTLQVLGDGPLGGLTVDASAAGTARAYVKNPEVSLPRGSGVDGDRATLGDAVGRNGIVSVLRDVGLRESFRGQTAIATGEIDDDVERYLTESEQIVSALACDAGLTPEGDIAWSAGLLLQALPGSDGAELVAAARERLTGGGFARLVAGHSLEAASALALEGLVVQELDRRPVTFRCPCSYERARASIALLGPAELAAMIVDEGQAEVICNFCRARYHFDDAALATLRRETDKPSRPS
jgi:molecular chaperone Hsp33